MHLTSPTPLTDFIDYGRWFQQHGHSGPGQPARDASLAERHGFDSDLQDGEMIAGHAGAWSRPGSIVSRAAPRSSNVSPAAGLSCCPTIDDLGVFDGQNGRRDRSGQSALESAAILHESGAGVEVMRADPEIRWLSRSAKLHGLSPRGAASALRADRRRASRVELDRRDAGDLSAPAESRGTNRLHIAPFARPVRGGWYRDSRTFHSPPARSVVNATEQAGRGERSKLSDGSARQSTTCCWPPVTPSTSLLRVSRPAHPLGAPASEWLSEADGWLRVVGPWAALPGSGVGHQLRSGHAIRLRHLVHRECAREVR